MLNIDESNAQVRCPAEEKVVVTSDVVDFYSASLENRKSVTIFETVYANSREPVPPFIVCLGIKIMKIWI